MAWDVEEDDGGRGVKQNAHACVRCVWLVPSAGRAAVHDTAAVETLKPLRVARGGMRTLTTTRTPHHR